MPAKSSIGASAVSLTGGTLTLAPRGVQLKADDDNSGSLYVGYANTVTAGSVDATDGVRLKAGQSYFIPPEKISTAAGGPNAANIWLIASATGQKVWYDVI